MGQKSYLIVRAGAPRIQVDNVVGAGQSCGVLDVITRAATAADVPAIHRLIAAGELRRSGRVMTAADAVAANLARTTLVPARDTVLVHSRDGALVGWAWMHLGKRAHVYVHPDFTGRGLGSQLLEWSEERARAVGSHDLGQTVDDADTAAAALLRAHGYTPTVTQWQLAIDLSAYAASVSGRPASASFDSGRPASPGFDSGQPASAGFASALPAGISVRAFRAGDERATYRMAEDAFADFQKRPRSYDEWSGLTIGRETFAPALSPLAFDGPRLVGAVLSMDRPGPEGHVERVAVDHDYRRRGIAQALLREAFHGFAAAGKQTCVLFTHSETGALSLYEKAGMAVSHSATHVRKALS